MLYTEYKKTYPLLLTIPLCDNQQQQLVESLSPVEQMSNKELGLQKVVNRSSQQSYLISIKISSIGDC
jgi:hypothetical protein